jgi:hypothetical protein
VSQHVLAVCRLGGEHCIRLRHQRIEIGRRSGGDEERQQDAGQRGVQPPACTQAQSAIPRRPYGIARYTPARLSSASIATTATAPPGTPTAACPNRTTRRPRWRRCRRRSTPPSGTRATPPARACRASR